MKLIAQKPCSFGGRNFFIGDEIPADLVAEPKTQERVGVLSVIEAECAQLLETEPGAYEGTIPIVISDGDEAVSLPMTPDEIQLAVDIRQQNAENAGKAIAEVTSENVLILIHALDERKTVKEAAKKQADTLYASTKGADA